MFKLPEGYTQGPIDDPEPLDEGFVLNALLRYNFLPNQKSDSDELPPVFDSISFTVPVAEILAAFEDHRGAPFMGYDAVVYKLTRFNGVARVCSIPHPKAYASLALTIAKNWNHLRYVSENETSRIVPRRHDDGRLVIMDYEDRVSASQQTLGASFGKRFLVRTDISNFYPSIYSHSIPWAVVGVDEAKKTVKNSGKWYNQLDRALRNTSRAETNGVAIGPGTSNVLSEAILARVDDELTSEFTYYRYMDDYTAYCGSHEEAERFVFMLAKALANYKLTLNAGKTAIQTLPRASTSDWVIELQNGLPDHTPITAHDVVHYLDYVVQIANHNPDGSVIKYGLKSLINVLLKENNETGHDVIQTLLPYALNLAFHHPILVPLLNRLFHKHQGVDGEFQYTRELQEIICENARLNRSDAVAWGLFLARKYSVPLQEHCSNQIIESRDCVPLLLMYLTGDQAQREQVVGFAKTLDQEDLYGMDQYWLLLYQLFKDGSITDPYLGGSSGQTVFSIMNSGGVDFVRT